uniref:Uncharacterized protein n=1 Tax=Anguilla anguilla TaxID=7936 RepID=A0A0E9RTG8_ANGAN
MSATFMLHSCWIAAILKMLLDRFFCLMGITRERSMKLGALVTV